LTWAKRTRTPIPPDDLALMALAVSPWTNNVAGGRVIGFFGVDTRSCLRVALAFGLLDRELSL